MQTTKRIELRIDGEWAIFIVTEQNSLDDNRQYYSAELTIQSSYGNFAHYWNSMGTPFEKFVPKLDKYYILGKIAHKVFDKDTYIAQIKKAIQDANAISQEKKDALNIFDYLCNLYDYDGDIIVYETQNEETIERILGGNFDGLDGRKWSQQAEAFLDKFWKPFIEKYPTAPILTEQPTTTQLEKYKQALEYIAQYKIQDSYMDAKEFQRTARKALDRR